MTIQHFDADAVESATPYPALIAAMGDAFRSGGNVPARQYHDIPQVDADDGRLLIMPAWNNAGYFGIKLATVNPRNASLGVPTVNGVYVLFDSATATPVAMVDAASLTARRTAAASAYAASRLARSDAKTLLMVGTGHISGNLIEAHCSIRNIDQILIWGRSRDKAAAVADRITVAAAVEVVTDLTAAIPEADIISTATMAREALVQGVNLKPGAHVDLVGAFTPEMRETDAEVFRRASQVWVDTLDGAETEAGDVLAAIAEGALRKDEITGDLFELAATQEIPRAPDEITVFKSVGTALEDLAAAMLCVSERVDELSD